MTKARDLANSAAAFAAVSATELGYVDGVTSAIQTQLDAKATLTGTETFTNKTLTSPVLTTPTISTVNAKGDLLAGTADNTVDRLAVGNNGEQIVADSAATSGLRYTSLFGANKNKVLNGDFTINQRAFTSTTTNGAYGFDRFNLGAVDGTTTYTAQTFTPGAAPVTGYEAKNYARIVTTGQTLSTALSMLLQHIEDVRTFANQTVTVSFWAQAGSGTPKIAVELKQNFGTGGSPSSEVNTYAGQVTLSTSWARYSVTIAVPSISGKTIGTDVNSSYLRLALFVSAGSNFDSRTGSLGIQSNTFNIWGVQVEAGSVATAFQTATGTIQGELAACQRYYQRKTSVGNATVFGMGQASSTTQAYYSIPIPVSFRVAPSVSHSSAAGWTASTGSAGGTIAAFQMSADSVSLQISGGAGLVAGNASALVGTSGSAYLELSAEL